MRYLRGAMTGFGVSLLLAAAALGQVVPGATLRLTPSLDPIPESLPAPTPVAASAPVPAPAQATAPAPASYGPQRITFPGGVNGFFDVVYAQPRGYRPLTLDLYHPAQRGTAMPLVVFVHGGGWNGGDKRQAAGFADFPRELAMLAAQGYVVASVSYRLSGEARFPAAVQDVKTAIRFLRGRAADLNLDTTRVALWGDGAGGQLAALAGVTCGVATFDPQAARADTGELPSACVQAVIDWYGASDLQTLSSDGKPDPKGDGFKAVAQGFQAPPSSDEGGYLGCEPASCPPMVARLASPLAFITGSSPAFLIQHGETDTVIPSAQSQKLHDALRKANVPAELITYPGVGHNFSRNGTPDVPTQRAAMEKVVSFLSATFPVVPLGSKATQQRGSLY